jgi:hypothetical protein
LYADLETECDTGLTFPLSDIAVIKSSSKQ